MSQSAARTGLVAFLVACATGAAAAAVAPPIPAQEVELSGLAVGTYPGNDVAAQVVTWNDDQVLLVSREEHAVYTSRSLDRGSTFGAETCLAGCGADPVTDHALSSSPDGWVVIAAIEASSQGNFQVVARASSDRGATWTAPAIILPGSGTGAGAFRIAVATGTGGLAAVLAYEEAQRFHYVVRSTDHGATWSAPVRVDPGATTTERALTLRPVALVIDRANVIHAAWDQIRLGGSGRSVWYTRSIDGGLTFEPERNLEDVIYGSYSSSETRAPSMIVAGDGSLVIAFRDAVGPWTDVIRSSDHGLTFQKSALLTPAGTPILRAGPAGSNTVLLASWDSAGVRIGRSTDAGITFGSPVLVTGPCSSVSVELARAPGGTWALSWTTVDGYAGNTGQANIRVSGDDGVTWGTPAALDAPTGGPAIAVAQTGGLGFLARNTLYAIFLDGRETNGVKRDVRATRSALPALALETDWRVDTDHSPRSNGETYRAADTAIDPDGTVYVAVEAASGTNSDIWILRSVDGARTFERTGRLGSHPEGSKVSLLPRVRASSGGAVYAVFATDDADTGVRTLRFNRSTDGGASWYFATDQVLGALASTPAGNWNVTPKTDDVQLTVEPPGTIFVAWYDGGSVRLARSFDGGATFSMTVDPGNVWSNQAPAMCADGGLLALGLSMYSSGVPHALVSTDSGATWAENVDLDVQGSSISQPHVLCPGDGSLVFSWSGYTSTLVPVARRWAHGTWGPVSSPTVPAGNGSYNSVRVASPSGGLVMSYADLNGAVYTSRSTDDGATWSAAALMSEPRPPVWPNAADPRLATSGDHVWLLWRDAAGLEWNPPVARLSRDAGVT